MIKDKERLDWLEQFIINLHFDSWNGMFIIEWRNINLKPCFNYSKNIRDVIDKAIKEDKQGKEA